MEFFKRKSFSSLILAVVITTTLFITSSNKVAAELFSGYFKKTIQISDTLKFDKGLELGIIEYVTGDLYQIPDADHQALLQLDNETKIVLDQFDNFESLSNANFKLIKNNKIKNIASQQQKPVLSEFKKAETKWFKQVDSQKIKVQQDIELQVSKIQETKTKIDSFNDSIKTANDALKDAREELNLTLQEIKRLMIVATDAVNADIVENSIPTIKRSLNHSIFARSLKSSTNGVCKAINNRLVYNEVGEKLCHYVKPLHDDLVDKPAFKLRRKLYPEYLAAKKTKVILKEKIDNLKRNEIKAIVIAENKYGGLKYLKNEVKKYNSKLMKANHVLTSIDSASNKRSFMKKAIQPFQRELWTDVNKVVASESSKYIKHVKHLDKLKFAEDIKVDSSMEHAVLVYQFKRRYSLDTLMIPFSTKKVLKEDKPTIRLTNRILNKKAYSEPNVLTLESKSLVSLLVYGS